MSQHRIVAFQPQEVVFPRYLGVRFCSIEPPLAQQDSCVGVSVCVLLGRDYSSPKIDTVQRWHEEPWERSGQTRVLTGQGTDLLGQQYQEALGINIRQYSATEDLSTSSRSKFLLLLHYFEAGNNRFHVMGVECLPFNDGVFTMTYVCPLSSEKMAFFCETRGLKENGCIILPHFDSNGEIRSYSDLKGWEIFRLTDSSSA